MTLLDTPPKSRRTADESAAPVTTLADAFTERVLESTTRAADELAKLNAAMDRVMISTGNGVIPAVRELADRLIAFLDTAAGWDEREPDGDERDDDGDLAEPSLGAGEQVDQIRAWSNRLNQTKDDREGQNEDGSDDQLEAGDLDISGEADGDTGGCVDDEPSLGSLDRRISQLRWCQPDQSVRWPHEDFEYDDADHESGIEDERHDAMEEESHGDTPIFNANAVFGVAD